MESSEDSGEADNISKTNVVGTSSRRSAVTEVLWPSIGWAVGLLVMGWPTFSSGFRRVQGGLGDSRLVNFSLEHSYRWLMGMPLAQDLWSPPIFFPVQNVATYTDLLLGVAPFYWVWRWLGCDPLTAFQAWMLSCWTLNFVACYLLLRHGLRISAAGSSLGAYLFAFGNPQGMSLAHQQLGPLFWLVLTLAGLIMMFRRPDKTSPARRWIASVAVWGGLVAQLYTAVYPLAFFTLALAVCVAFVLAVRSLRVSFFGALKEHLVPLLVVGVVAAALATPITARYQATAATVGMIKQQQVHLPKPLVWLLPGNANRVYGKWQRAVRLGTYRSKSQSGGFGVVTLTMCAAGLWIGRRRREVQLAVVGVAGLAFLTLTFPGGWSPWWAVREVVPGTAALRAVGRVGLLILFPAALGLAIAVDRLAARRRWIIVAVLILCVVAEQAQRRSTFDKAAVVARVHRIASNVPTGAETFLVVLDGPPWDKEHVSDDAAWAALAAGVPTVNGRYGRFPQDYPFRKPWIRQPSDRTALAAELEAWTTAHGLDPGTATLIEVSPRPPRGRGGRR